MSNRNQLPTDTRQAVPRNAARLICGNCETPFVDKDYNETFAARSSWEKDIALLETSFEQAKEATEKAIVSRDKARFEVGSWIYEWEVSWLFLFLFYDNQKR